MSTYASKPALIPRPAHDIYDRFNDLTVLETQLNNLPQEQRDKIGDVRFTPDSIEINTPQVGKIEFKVVDRQPYNKITFGTPSSPIPLTMDLELTPKGDDATEAVTKINVELPMMLRPLVGPKLQDAAEQFSKLLGQLAG
ncbi:MAG: hypothetical protein LUC85_05440 [Bacteroidales bacterium]|nr:hypothetical protein [Bacteroidales bacterium]MCD8394262.1 hypothetical protein [Bacteroidales bacterium]